MSRASFDCMGRTVTGKAGKADKTGTGNIVTFR